MTTTVQPTRQTLMETQRALEDNEGKSAPVLDPTPGDGPGGVPNLDPPDRARLRDEAPLAPQARQAAAAPRRINLRGEGQGLKNVDLIIRSSQQLMASRPLFQVYNPSHYTETFEVYGHPMRFAPREVQDIPHKMRWMDTRDIHPNPMRVKTLWDRPQVIEVLSEDMAIAICADNRMGPKGFIVLVGDGRDDERVALADQMYLARRVPEVRQIEQEWIAHVVAVHNASPGVIPRQPPAVREAIDWLERYENGEFDRVSEEDAVVAEQDHARLLARHPELAAQVKAQAKAAEISRRNARRPPPEAQAEIPPDLRYQREDDDEVQAPEPQEDEAPGEVEITGQHILLKAEELKLELGPKDYRGLALNDQATMQRIAGRIGRALEREEKKKAAKEGRS